MSSSQLLTITESHGFRALLAAVAWIVGRLARIGRGLRTLSCGNRQPARMDDGSKSWLRILNSIVANARREPVLWFDTSGGREGPHMRGLRPQPSLALCYVSHSQVRPLADQLAAAHRDWTGFRT